MLPYPMSCGYTIRASPWGSSLSLSPSTFSIPLDGNREAVSQQFHSYKEHVLLFCKIKSNPREKRPTPCQERSNHASLSYVMWIYD